MKVGKDKINSNKAKKPISKMVFFGMWKNRKDKKDFAKYTLSFRKHFLIVKPEVHEDLKTIKN